MYHIPAHKNVQFPAHQISIPVSAPHLWEEVIEDDDGWHLDPHLAAQYAGGNGYHG